MAYQPQVKEGAKAVFTRTRVPLNRPTDPGCAAQAHFGFWTLEPALSLSPLPSHPPQPQPLPPVLPPTVPSALALLLGRGGLLPFLAGAALVALGPPEWRSKAAWALAAYAAVIVSFLGGIHWGLAFRQPAAAGSAGEASNGLLAWGVVPSLLAWPALLLPPAAGLVALGASLWLCYAVDRRLYPTQGAAAWLGLRLQLTAVASFSCWAAALVVA